MARSLPSGDDGMHSQLAMNETAAFSESQPSIAQGVSFSGSRAEEMLRRTRIEKVLTITDYYRRRTLNNEIAFLQDLLLQLEDLDLEMKMRMRHKLRLLLAKKLEGGADD